MPRLCFLAACLLATLPGTVQAAAPSLMELELADRTIQGKIVALDDSTAWVMQRDGRLEKLKIEEILRVTTVAPQFEPMRAAELRDQLRREFRQGFDVVGTEHYLIVAPRERARQYAQVFEEIYRTFYVYFRVRSFRISPPEFPLVAIVFPDHAGFGAYCRKDGLPAVRGLMGYYQLASNRVALFDPGEEEISGWRGDTLDPWQWHAESANALLSDPRSSILDPRPTPLTTHHSRLAPRVATITAGLRDTMIHEATHQVAFNTGLHSRIGENPIWIVEGLATVFEAPGIRDPNGDRRVSARLNRDRFVWFTNYAEQRRPKKSLAAFISSDKPFEAAVLDAMLDAYSQAWALTFYLLETRSGKYARYLQAIAARDPLQPYPPDERLADFQTHFGQNLDVLESDFLRYMRRLRDDE